MDVGTEQQHASSWLRPEAPRVGSYEPTPGMLPSEDIGEMFTPHFLDQGSHMNAAAGYYNQAARAMGGYRSSHGKHLFNFISKKKGNFRGNYFIIMINYIMLLRTCASNK
jgi:hypothetical protein